MKVYDRLPTRELRQGLPQSPRRPVAREVGRMLDRATEDTIAEVDQRLCQRSQAWHDSQDTDTAGATLCLGAATAVLAHGALTGLGGGHALAIGGLAVAAWAMLHFAHLEEREATRTEISERMLRAEADGYLAHHPRS